MTSVTPPNKIQGKFSLVASTDLQAVYTGAYVTVTPPVYTARRAEKHCMTSFFYTGRIHGPYIRVTGTHYPYIYGPSIRPVYIRAQKVQKNAPVYTGRIYG